MSDPREFDRDPNLSRNAYVGRQSGDSSAWIVGAVIVLILLGLAAYSYRSTAHGSGCSRAAAANAGTGHAAAAVASFFGPAARPSATTLGRAAFIAAKITPPRRGQ
jgi:hypothetical protein